MIRRIGAFLAAVLATYVVGALVSTQLVMNQIAGLGLPVSLGVRTHAIVHDLVGMATAYVPLIAAGLLAAFPVAALILRFAPAPRILGYALAGGTALLVLHLLLYAALDIHPLPSTRTALGLAAQVAAGAVGGYVFVRLAFRTSKV